MAQPGEGGKRSGRVFYLDGCSGENRRVWAGHSYQSFQLPLFPNFFLALPLFRPIFHFLLLFTDVGKWMEVGMTVGFIISRRASFPPSTQGQTWWEMEKNGASPIVNHPSENEEKEEKSCAPCQRFFPTYLPCMATFAALFLYLII